MLARLAKLAIFIFFLMRMESAQAIASLPWSKVASEVSNVYGWAINPHYANLLNDSNALGIEFSFGTKEFRLEGTLASVIKCQHLLELTAEYLSQDNTFTFYPGPATTWDEQHAISAGYSYILNFPWLKSLNLSGYEVKSRDEQLRTLYELDPDVLILYRNISGATGYGSVAGITFYTPCATTINLDFFYDKIHYRSQAEFGLDRSGVGGGLEIIQQINPFLSLNLEGMQRVLYNQYQARLNWLIITHCRSAFQVGIMGKYTTGQLPQSPETRVGLSISYIWNIPSNSLNNGISQCLSEFVLKSATKPLIQMPQIFVARDQKIVP